MLFAAHTAQGEWIEMRKDTMRRAAAKVHQASEELRTGIHDSSGADVKTDRVVLYVHGGAFVRGSRLPDLTAQFFSSLETHRYQIQRHARKLGGRAFAVAYRLAPQCA